MTDERVVNGDFCDEWSGWNHDTTDWWGVWILNAGPGDWFDLVSCAASVSMGGTDTERGVWQTVDFTDVNFLTFQAYIGIYDFEGGHPYFVVRIDGNEVYRVTTGWELLVSPSIDVSALTGEHVVSFLASAQDWTIYFDLRAVSAIAEPAVPFVEPIWSLKIGPV